MTTQIQAESEIVEIHGNESVRLVRRNEDGECVELRELEFVWIDFGHFYSVKGVHGQESEWCASDKKDVAHAMDEWEKAAREAGLIP